MNRQLFELALDKLRSSDWEYFEELSSKFLASDFSSLRTMANPSGDGGRDSELFKSDDAHRVAIQYSVSEDWNEKIKKTLKRLEEKFNDITVLIYMSNQTIGAKGDEIKKASLKKGVSLDIRDKNWFLERFDSNDSKYQAAKEITDIIARPFLASEGIIEKRRPALSSTESKAALTYLGMQWEDEKTDKGLTKIAYESLVRAALRDSCSEKRISREKIYERIFKYMPSTIEGDIKKYVDSALTRLSKKTIKHWSNLDEYCLSFEEIERLNQKLAESEKEECEFSGEIVRLVKNETATQNLCEESIEEIAERISKIIDIFLIKSGESFVSSVLSGSVNMSNPSLLKDIIFEDISSTKTKFKYTPQFPDIGINVASRLLSSKKDSVKFHLKKISDAYTLFSFLRETPDIQKVTTKIFSYAKIWLDTTIILPLFVDALEPNEEERRYSKIINALTESGVELRVTEGVIQEVLHHIRVSETCSRSYSREWEGRIPFLYFNYIELGYSPANFSLAMEKFRGDSRPVDDIGDYLSSSLGIRVESLNKVAQSVDEDLRFSIERLWRNAHESRRNGSNGKGDQNITDTLIKHDVECYVGVIGLRNKESVTELGYKHWLMTIDSLAWKIRDQIKTEFPNAPNSPLISFDFLSSYLSFGPLRSKLTRTHEQLLPIFLDLNLSDSMPKELIEIASEVRKNNEGIDEHLVRRKVRDACDKMRGRFGNITRGLTENDERGLLKAFPQHDESEHSTS